MFESKLDCWLDNVNKECSYYGDVACFQKEFGRFDTKSIRYNISHAEIRQKSAMDASVCSVCQYVSTRNEKRRLNSQERFIQIIERNIFNLRIIVYIPHVASFHWPN